MNQDKDKQNARNIGDNSFADNNSIYENVLEHAVKLLDRFNHYAGAAGYEISRAINGKNSVTRAVGARDAQIWLHKLEMESQSWDTVLKNMKAGKDIHIQENCKSEKLDIVSGSEHEFGQYIVNKSSGKFCKENTDGKAYIEKATSRGDL